MIENLSFTGQTSELIISDIKNDTMTGLVWDLIESIPNFISIWEGGKVLYANPAFYKALGLNTGDITLLNKLVENEGYFQVHPDDFDYSPENTNAVKNEVTSGIIFHKEMRMKSRIDSDYRWYNTYIVKSNDPESKVIIEIDEDINEKKLASERLKDTLKEKEELVNEKELLIKEIHHRVKNNFQVISSLLKLQSGRAKDDSVKMILEESRTRIISMSKIHESLYTTGNLEKINFKENITEIVCSLVELYKGSSRTVTFDINCPVPDLGIDKAIPCSLILNELISNSLKYAFNHWEESKIIISLNYEGDFYRFYYKDNGIGYPEGYSNKTSDSLGLLIIKTFASQLGGEVYFLNNNGAECSIIFPK